MSSSPSFSWFHVLLGLVFDLVWVVCVSRLDLLGTCDLLVGRAGSFVVVGRSCRLMVVLLVGWFHVVVLLLLVV